VGGVSLDLSSCRGLGQPNGFSSGCVGREQFKVGKSHFVIIIIIIYIIIIITIIIIISVMQGIYTYIPETDYVPREYSVAAILLLLFMVLISLVSVLNLL